MVQTAHAAFDAGSLSGPHKNISLVLCQIDSEEDLKREKDRLDQLGIPYTAFYEPDLSNQLTAIATLPVTKQQRRKLNSWKLWSL